jgi:hypothetical protein
MAYMTLLLEIGYYYYYYNSDYFDWALVCVLACLWRSFCLLRTQVVRSSKKQGCVDFFSGGVWVVVLRIRQFPNEHFHASFGLLICYWQHSGISMINDRHICRCC